MEHQRSLRGAFASLYAIVVAIALPAQTLTTLHNFNMKNGNYPAGMLQATDGNLYGITNSGGPSNNGTIFRITPGGAFATVYNFCSLSSCADGSVPTGMIQATDGNLYGTTSTGGANNIGTVFKLTLSGALTTLYSFCTKNTCPGGNVPQEGLVEGADGNFYGTTFYGGPDPSGIGYGGVFKITPGGKLTSLYYFCTLSKCADGYYPLGGLVQTSNGDFYGTTSNGGSYAPYDGTIFKITPNGTLTTLYSFNCSKSGCAMGGQPHAGLTLASNGELYGTTMVGGKPAPFTGGTVFAITTGDMLTTLNSFCNSAGCPQGDSVQAPLIQGSDGNLYGTSTVNGTSNGGAVFSVTPNGALATVYSFCFGKQCTGGYYPDGGLVQATNGDFYGTTSRGGTHFAGTIFRLSTGLKPFVTARPAFGKAGAPVRIQGTNLTGATRVTFNGVAADFTVVSASLIITAVPSGATPGRFQVVIPSGTLSSNAAFQALP